MTSPSLVAVMAAALVAGAAVVVSAQPAAEIQKGATVVVASATPVRAAPDEAAAPLRSLPTGAILTVEESQGDWLRVRFADPRLGPRSGWVPRRFVELPANSVPAQRPGSGSPARPPAPRGASPVRVRVFGGVAVDRMAAVQSFEAVTGSAAVTSFGGGVQVAGLWRNLFVEAGVEHSRTTGERVFVFDGVVYGLDIPLRIDATPVDVVAGWRVPTRTRLTPFAAGGITWLRYDERSDFADPSEDVRDWSRGIVGLAGVEVRASPRIHLRTEVRYRFMEEALGASGVSREFGETRLGGVGGSLKVVFGR